ARLDGRNNASEIRSSSAQVRKQVPGVAVNQLRESAVLVFARLAQKDRQLPRRGSQLRQRLGSVPFIEQSVQRPVPFSGFFADQLPLPHGIAHSFRVPGGSGQ